MPRLQNDMNMNLISHWRQWGHPNCLDRSLDSNFTQNKVKVTVDLYGLDRNNIPVRKNAVLIFPPPSGPLHFD